MIYHLLLLLFFPITIIFSQPYDDYDSGEIAYNNTSINKEEDKVVVYYYQPPNEWNKLKAILLISAVVGCLAFLTLCCVCGVKAACSPIDRTKRKYLSHA